MPQAILNYVIRPANLIDISGLLPLLAQLGYPCSFNELERRLANYINDEHYGVAVAVANQFTDSEPIATQSTNNIVGCIAWSCNKLFLSDRQRLHVEALVVSATYRGQGIGSRLLKHLENITSKLAPAVIAVTSGVQRAKDGTHKFYENHGYSSSGPQAKLYFIKDF